MRSSTARLGGLLVVLAAFLAPGAAFAQRATLSGRVTDARNGDALPGASVAVLTPGTQVPTGAATDGDGRYRIELGAGRYTIVISYIGYAERRTDVTLAAGETRTLDAALDEGEVSLNESVVTASRQQEQVLDAPASVTVLGTAEIQQSVTPSSVGVLRNTAGVDMAQTGVDRQEVVLRGFNNAFSGATYTLVDYRQAAVASLGVNVYSIMPNLPIDLERVEVVRGPGSALYGPGVDAGVVHFLTKDPFSSPGTSISVTGGERSLLGVEARQAGFFGRFGYKFTGAYTRADDWRLNAGDAIDSVQFANDFRYADPSTAPDAQKLDANGKLQRNYDYYKFNGNGLLQYRFSPSTTFSLNGGYSAFTGIVLSGIGTLQAKDFGYAYGQARLQAGNFFSQFYINQNDAGKSYVYGSGQEVVDNGLQMVFQSQYDYVASDRFRLIGGIDLRRTTPDTEGTILGRNEEDDTVDQYGVYAQASSDVTSALSLTGAVRGDYNNIVDDFQLSPRVAAVYKLDPFNSVRLTYNRAFSSPGTNSLFLDIAGRTVNLDASGRQLIFQARGAAQGFSFNNFRTNGNATLSLPIPGLFGGQFPYQRFPLLAPYAAAAAGAAPLFLNGSITVPGVPLTAQQKTLFGQLIGYSAQNAGAVIGLDATTTAGRLGIAVTGDVDADSKGYRIVAAPTDIPQLKQTTNQTVEAGYKGLFAERFLFELDGYYTQKKNFIGPLQQESPLVYLSQGQFTTDVATRIGQVLATSTDQTIQQLRAGLRASGLTDAQIAGIIGGVLANGLTQGATGAIPIAVVQPDQEVLNGGTVNQVGAFLSYRNFGTVEFFGVDASAQFLYNNRLSLFGNLSFVSDDFFDNEELDEAGTSLEVALNAPKFKARTGFSYSVPQSFSFNAAARYQDGFPVRSGPTYYSGNVPSYFVLDVGAGYDFANVARGLRVDLLVQNILNNEHREFTGAPEIGRLALVRLGYTLR